MLYVVSGYAPATMSNFVHEVLSPETRKKYYGFPESEIHPGEFLEFIKKINDEAGRTNVVLTTNSISIIRGIFTVQQQHQLTPMTYYIDVHTGIFHEDTDKCPPIKDLIDIDRKQSHMYMELKPKREGE